MNGKAIIHFLILFLSKINEIQGDQNLKIQNYDYEELKHIFSAEPIDRSSSRRSRRNPNSGLSEDAIEHRRKAVRLAIMFFELTQKVGHQCHFKDNTVMKIFVNKSNWESEAAYVVQMANHLTSLWRLQNSHGKLVLQDEEIFFGMAKTNVMFSEEIYGSAICFDYKSYKQYERFCPYGYRDSKLNNTLHVMDLNHTDYLNPVKDNRWWLDGKKNAQKINMDDYMTKEMRSSHNITVTNLFPHIPFMYDFWTIPYFDCVGGKEWMFSYVAPFFNKSNNFIGVVTMDVNLGKVDINQCDPSDDVFTAFPNFTASHLCKSTTKCEPIRGQGFKRGMYNCVCKKGYYFDGAGEEKYFKGSDIEDDYDLYFLGFNNSKGTWKNPDSFQCLKCSKGCEECVDNSPCLFSSNETHRVTLLVLNQIIMCLALTAAGLVIWKKKEKAIRGASPVFLLYAIFGSVLMYIEIVIVYFPPTNYLCALRYWIFHMGFALTFGSLLLKTWRIAVIFRVRSAKKIELTDTLLSKRLLIVLGVFTIYLLIWTLTNQPDVEDGRTSQNLKYKTCSDNWFEYTILIFEFLFLMWGIFLCWRVRSAPNVYNESKYISWSTYNTVFVFLFTSTLRVLIRNSSDPDILYTIEFIRVHVSATTMLVLLLVPKGIMVFKSHECKDRANSCTSQHSSYKMHSGDEGFGLECPYEDENESLKTEITRLSARLAIMRNICMKQENIHIKPNKRESKKCHIHYSVATPVPHPHAHTQTRQGLLEQCESGCETHSFGRNGTIIDRDSPSTEDFTLTDGK